MKRIFLRLLAVLFVVNFSCSTDKAENNEDEELEPIVGNSIAITNAFPNLSFSRPIDFQSSLDNTNSVFVGEQGGLIKVFENKADVEDTATFLDISSRTVSTSELGLLGFAFHPSYNINGYLYVTYTPSENLSVLSRFKVSELDSNKVDESSEAVLLRIAQPYTNHNGGQLAFGDDGYLYVSVGDGGGSGDPNGHAQNLETLLGTILRIDVDNTDAGLNYAIPNDNPFVGTPNARPEIYAYGLRNPWRFSFDNKTKKLWTGDVGQGKLEEINTIDKGGNYGWNILEGTSCFGSATCDASETIAPVFEYGREKNDKSITGGYVYRGTKISNLQGYYVYGDFVSGRIWALEANLSEKPNNELILDTELNISSFGTDQNNELYICSFDGNIYKFSVVTN